MRCVAAPSISLCAKILAVLPGHDTSHRPWCSCDGAGPVALATGVEAVLHSTMRILVPSLPLPDSNSKRARASWEDGVAGEPAGLASIGAAPGSGTSIGGAGMMYVLGKAGRQGELASSNRNQRVRYGITSYVGEGRRRAMASSAASFKCNPPLIRVACRRRRGERTTSDVQGRRDAATKLLQGYVRDGG